LKNKDRLLEKRKEKREQKKKTGSVVKSWWETVKKVNRRSKYHIRIMWI
jgi:hypothetical protein